MTRGAYLTRDPYGEPADPFEREAKQWLLAHNGTEGQPVMKSLAELIRSFCQARMLK